MHHPSANLGNGIILCGENVNIPNKRNNFIEEIKFSKMSNYINYLSKKHLALVKLDIEGSEGKAINSGLELITKYHIPFFFIEFNPNYLKMQGTNPRTFLELFVNNGYKLSLVDFLSKKYSTIDELLNKSSTNLYIVFSKFLD